MNLVSWKYKPRPRNQFHEIESNIIKRDFVYLGIDKESVMARPMVKVRDVLTGRELMMFSREWRLLYDVEGYYNIGETYSMDVKLVHQNLCINSGIFGAMEGEITFIRNERKKYL